jgi:hypothetical protein
VILIHVYNESGSKCVVTLDGTDRQEAREFCHALVADGSGNYRAAIYDRMSERYQWDTDDAWLTPGAS